MLKKLWLKIYTKEKLTHIRTKAYIYTCTITNWRHEVLVSRNAFNPLVTMRFQRFFPFHISQVLPAKTRKVRFNSTCHCGLIGLNLLGVLAFASRKILSNLDRPDAHVFVSLVFVTERSQRFLISMSTSESGVSTLSWFRLFSASRRIRHPRVRCRGHRQ